MILKILHSPTKEEQKLLLEEFPNYIKLISDIEQQIIYGGSRLHYDCEQILLNKENSKQENIWSGGINTLTKKIEYEAVSNIKPLYNNPSTEILDPNIRNKFKILVKQYFPDYE